MLFTVRLVSRTLHLARYPALCMLINCHCFLQLIICIVLHFASRYDDIIHLQLKPTYACPHLASCSACPRLQRRVGQHHLASCPASPYPGRLAHTPYDCKRMLPHGDSTRFIMHTCRVASISL